MRSRCVGGGQQFHCRAGSSPPPAQPPSEGAGFPAPPDAGAAAHAAPVAGESGPRLPQLMSLCWGGAGFAAGMHTTDREIRDTQTERQTLNPVSHQHSRLFIRPRCYLFGSIVFNALISK